MKGIFNWFSKKPKDKMDVLEENKDKKFVTLGWDGRPTVSTYDGRIFSRKNEDIFNKEYYPTGEPGEWPIDPKTGEKLPILKSK